MEYSSAVQRNEKLTDATIWVNLENMVSERIQPQKATYTLIPFIQNIRKGKSTGTQAD